jgi:hypothetical protein
MNLKQTKIALMLALAAMSPSSFAASDNDGSKSVKHSVGVAGSVSQATVSVVAASVVVPVFIVGTAVQGSINAHANDRFDKPLPIADETVIAGPSPKDAVADKTKVQGK